nr:SHOCT domain-containing protein [Candidatus Freyarchaeota archaeon]
MKKRVILAVTIMLLLTLPLLVILSTSNPPIIFLNSPYNNPNVNSKSYIGNGDQLNALLYITNNYNSAPNATNTTSNIYIPCPEGWKIVWANLSFSNIIAPNTTIIPNNDTDNASFVLSSRYAMSFRLTNNAYLDNISVLLTTTYTDARTNFYVYNATNSSGRPEPYYPIASRTGVAIAQGTRWNNISFSHILLNISRTYDNTFFIGVERNYRSQYWRAVNYSTSPFLGYGYVYQYIYGVWAYLPHYDCKLKVNVSASTTPDPESAKPSEIGLTINGSTVQDIDKGSGEWIDSTASFGTNGYIFYDVNSTWMSTVSFSYVWNVTYGKDTIADTNFVVISGSDAFWNVTVNATGNDAFPLTSYGINHINITGMPVNWEGPSSMAYNMTGGSWIALDSYPPDTISFPASNGTWIVNCTSPNHEPGIGFEVGGVQVDNATLDDVLNVTVNFYTPVGGTVNLSIYDPSQTLNYTAEKNIALCTSTWFTWNISNNATSPGSYNVTLSSKYGFMVGYNETTLEIVPLINTALDITSFPSNVVYPNNASVILYYHDETGQGIEGAFITAYDGTKKLDIQWDDKNDGIYNVTINFGADFGDHQVYLTASKRFYASSSSDPISINYAPTYFIVINPQYIALIGLMYNAMMEQNKGLTSYLLIGVVVGSLVAATVVADRLRRKREVPIKALASLENIIVDHILSGVTLWVFDFIKMDQDVGLLSGFMSAVKSFLDEMKEGDLRKLETERRTFIREDGEFLTATCIASINTGQEEEWIRQRLHKFLFDAEQQHRNKLENWIGNVKPFKASFMEILASVIDLDKAEKLRMERISKMQRDRESFKAELINLNSQLKNLSQQFKAGEISEEEFEARKTEIQLKQESVQSHYDETELLLSRVPLTSKVKQARTATKKSGKYAKQTKERAERPHNRQKRRVRRKTSKIANSPHRGKPKKQEK